MGQEKTIAPILLLSVSRHLKYKERHYFDVYIISIKKLKTLETLNSVNMLTLAVFAKPRRGCIIIAVRLSIFYGNLLLRFCNIPP